MVDKQDSAFAFAIRSWISLGIFIVLMVWAVFFPYSGDGDSVLHYLNARDTAGHWANALYAWTRPGYKIPLSLFAAHGIMAAHFFNTIITVAVAWNTVKLAEELEIPRAPLAGLLLILQPFVFALGSDTMTELPMALGIVLAVRWWRNGKYALACLMVGYLPSVRPEGFFFGVIFGVMVLIHFARCRRPQWVHLRIDHRTSRSNPANTLDYMGPSVLGPRIEPERSLLADLGYALALLACLSAGLITWVLLCWVFSFDHDALLVLHYWSWPPGSYSFYATGTILHYVINWPVYCGLPLFVLFVAGIAPAIRRSMWLPWMVWLTVIGVHSILYWRGWFASCGLIRIMACSAPITALVCLYGWNAIASQLNRRHWRPAVIVFSLSAVAWVVGNYCLDRNRMHFLPLQRCAAYVKSHHLLDNQPYFFAGDKIATAMLQGPDLPDDKLMAMPCDKDQIAKNLAELPIGSIGIWDNEQAPVWHGHTIDELAQHGFTILYETHAHVFSFTSLIRGRSWLDMRYVVLRKDAQGMQP